MNQKTLLTSNKQKVVYSVFGCGEPLVFIHGVGMQALAWHPQIEYFKDSYQVIAVNMAGHNGSDSLAEGATLPDFVSWFNDVFDALGLKQATVIGHSMGALIAQGFSIAYPEKVTSLALLNIVSERSKEAQQSVKQRAQKLHNGETTIDSTLERWFDNNPAEANIEKTVKNYLMSVDKMGYFITYNAFAHGDNVYTQEWPSVKCPVLLITGEFDKNSSPDMSEKLGKIIPNGQVKIILGHKHMVNLTAADEINQVIDEWLTRKN